MFKLIPARAVLLRLVPVKLIIPVLLLTAIITGSPAFAEEHGNRTVIRPVLKKGVLLIASRHLVDPYFGQAVILLTQYDHAGTTGIIINRQTQHSVSGTFPEIAKRLPVLEYLYLGGPVASTRVSLLLQSSQNIDGANEIMKGIYHIDTQVLFERLDFGSLKPANGRLFSGFAGWAPGQLESEMQRGDWYTWQASASTIFTPTPEDLWDELIDLASARWVSR